MDLMTASVGLLFFAIFLYIYFLPTIIGRRKNHEHIWWIFLINLFGAGTGIRWFIVLIWAVNGPHSVYGTKINKNY